MDGNEEKCTTQITHGLEKEQPPTSDLQSSHYHGKNVNDCIGLVIGVWR